MTVQSPASKCDQASLMEIGPGRLLRLHEALLSLASSLREVLNVAFGDALKATPFRSSDVDALLDKFSTTHSDDFTPESIQSYAQTFDALSN